MFLTEVLLTGVEGGKWGVRPRSPRARADADIFMARELRGERRSVCKFGVVGTIGDTTRKGERKSEGGSLLLQTTLFFLQVDVASFFRGGCKGHARERGERERVREARRDFPLPFRPFLSLFLSRVVR